MVVFHKQGARQGCSFPDRDIVLNGGVVAVKAIAGSAVGKPSLDSHDPTGQFALSREGGNQEQRACQ